MATDVSKAEAKILEAIAYLAEQAVNPDYTASYALDYAKAANELASAQAWLRRPARTGS